MRGLALCLAVCAVALVAGCGSVPNGPRRMDGAEAAAGRRERAFALDGSKQPNYWQRLNGQGRIVTLLFDEDGNGKPEHRVSLDELDMRRCRHLVILLDGVPFELAQEAYREGHFRLFHRPSRLYSCFPSMTWLSFPLVFHTGPPAGIEADYFDRATGRRSDAMAVYNSRANEPWRKCVQYRCGSMVDGMCYVSPWAGFVHEMKAIRERYETRGHHIFVGYNGSSAGMGTAKGREGIQEVLEEVDHFCEDVMAKAKGHLTITMFADHGHSLTPAKRLPLKKHLRSCGFNPTDRLDRSTDVVVPSFGLCTDAVIYAEDPVAVAHCLLDLEGVDLVVYPTGRSITVRKGDSAARIHQRDGRYRYEVVRGDPLELAPIIEKLKAKGKVDADGFIDDRAFFEATALHTYPDPLYRIWLCWHGAVKNPPDIVLSLKNEFFWGRADFDFFANVASTHGSLNYANTVTFAMTTAGPLPPLLRLIDLKPALAKYFPLPGP